jgi:hypothetical protein
MENERRGSTRAVHRYSRPERFVSVVYQLLGARGNFRRVRGSKSPEAKYDEGRRPERVFLRVCEANS